MKLPKEIKGKNRIRDLQICRDYLDGKTPQEIKDTRSLKLSVRRIQKILSNNAVFVNERIGWDKSKRLHTLQRVADKAGLELCNKKDILDVIKEMRFELEGDKPSNEYQNQQVVIVKLHEAASQYKNGNGQPRVEVEKVEKGDNGHGEVGAETGLRVVV